MKKIFKLVKHKFKCAIEWKSVLSMAVVLSTDKLKAVVIIRRNMSVIHKGVGFKSPSLHNS